MPAKYAELIEAVNNDNAEGLHPETKNGIPLPEGGKEALLSASAFEVAAVGTHSAADACQAVLAYAGASLKRDAVDERIVGDVRNGSYEYEGSNGSSNGLIDSQADAGGWPAYVSSEKPADADNDGIADAWAAEHLPASKTYRDIDPATGYCYLELYINSIVADIMKAGAAKGSDSPCTADF